jgi:antitoxin YefM
MYQPMYNMVGEAMIKHIPISETRKIINTLASELDPDDTVSVTNRGKEVLAILPWETYEALIETLEIAADPEFLKELRLGIQNYKEGKLIDFDEVKRSLDSV